jgi:predicted GNAT family acetyltransferase
VVEALPGTLFAFGEDPEATWTLLHQLPSWTSVVIAPSHAQALGNVIARGAGRAVCYQDVLLYTLPTPVVRLSHPVVRLMTSSESEMVANGPGGPVGAAYRSTRALLAEGYVAGAVVDDVLVARAHTSCQSSRYADVAVATAEVWRGNGLASAAASLVCEEAQQSGRIPIWSTTWDNTASQRIAQKLGFITYSQVTYISHVPSVDL